MAKITRVSQLLFGSSGPGGDFGVFGSLNTTPTYSKDPATMQSLAAFLTGWAAAVKTGEVPALEDMNSLFYLLFYQVCYLLQQGVAEWDAGTTYYTNSIVNYGGVLYYSIQDTNLNKNPSSETAWWGVVAQDSLYVKLAGDQTVAGIKTFSSFPVTPSGAPSSNYQVANKKYVDDNIVAPSPQVGFGSWVAKANNTVYQAATDGFVTAWLGAVNQTSEVSGFTDGNNPPTALRAYCRASSQSASHGTGITMPIKKGDYWKVTGADNVNWIPLGS